ncbi:MAG: hypothetical protein ACP5UZ_05565 [Thermoplasmata archaeon]
MSIPINGIITFWVSFAYYFVAAALISSLVGSIFTYSRHGGGRIAGSKRRHPIWKLVVGSFLSTLALTVISYLLYPVINPLLYAGLKYTISMVILSSTAYFYWILRGFGRRISRNLEWIAGPIILSAVAFYIAYSS